MNLKSLIKKFLKQSKDFFYSLPPGNRKVSIAIFLGIVIWSLFTSKIEEIVKDKIIDNFLDSCTPSLANDFIFIFLFISCIVYFLNKILHDKLIPSLHGLLCFILIGLVYVNYRFLVADWPFSPFSFNDSIKYADAFVFLGLLSLNYLKKRNPPIEIKNKENELLEDGSETFGKEDILKREKLAKKISDHINNTLPKKAFAIGIIGKWGSGKTEFLKNIESILRTNKDNLIVNFNPWHSKGSSLIIEDFFETLRNELKLYDSSLSNQLKSYAETLTAVEDNMFSKVLNVLSSSYLDNSISDKHENIGNAIEKINKRIIIIIDDIDRLTSIEILEILRLIRNTANFSKTIFLVAYDFEYVVKSLSKTNSKININSYLEKIFQLQIPLPSYKKSLITREFINLLTRNKSETDKQRLQDSIRTLDNVKLRSNL